MNYELCSQFMDIALWAPVDLVEVRQNAIYGMGVFSKYINRETFKSLTPKFKQTLDAVTSHPEARSEDNLVVTENAVISLGFMAVFQTQDQADVTAFLTRLPLEGEDEAREAYEFVIEQTIAKSGALIANGQL